MRTGYSDANWVKSGPLNNSAYTWVVNESYSIPDTGMGFVKLCFISASIFIVTFWKT